MGPPIGFHGIRDEAFLSHGIRDSRKNSHGIRDLKSWRDAGYCLKLIRDTGGSLFSLWYTGLIYAAGHKIFESSLGGHELAFKVVTRQQNI